MLRRIKHIVILVFFLGQLFSVRGQIMVQRHQINIVNDSLSGRLYVSQKSVIVNRNNHPVKRLVLLNWANAYANKHTGLAQSIFENYNLNFHFSNKKDRGEVRLYKMQLNGVDETNIKRIQTDVYEVNLQKELQQKDSINVEFQYVIKLPK